MLYKKRISVGAFLKKGEDYKDGDTIEILSEGKEIEGQFGLQDIFSAKTREGKEGNVTFNSTSINNMIDAYGEDGKNWIGKKAKVWKVKMSVQGKIKDVYFFSHPDADLTDDGIFSIPGKDPKEKDIPIVEEEDIN
jgi:hypothetical protein